MGNLRITSIFARKIASIRSLRIILLNFGLTNHFLTSKDYGCLRGDIEDNIKLGLIDP